MAPANELDHVRMAQLLCSRICHDLAGPAGAVNAGLELIDEGDDGGALDLVKLSSSALTAKLAFFRAAFGMSGGGGGFKATDIRALVEGLGGKEGLDVSWPKSVHDPQTFDADHGKVLLNMLAMADEALPRGGRIDLQTASVQEGLGVEVTASGKGAELRADIHAALERGRAAGEVTARNIHAVLAQELARLGGGRITWERAPEDRLRLTVLFPKAPPD